MKNMLIGLGLGFVLMLTVAATDRRGITVRRVAKQQDATTALADPSTAWIKLDVETRIFLLAWYRSEKRANPAMSKAQFWNILVVGKILPEATKNNAAAIDWTSVEYGL